MRFEKRTPELRLRLEGWRSRVVLALVAAGFAQTTDELHGFGLGRYNINIVIDPGETKHVTFVADKTGVYPYYCTNFCSALHQEMQGYMIVTE